MTPYSIGSDDDDKMTYKNDIEPLKMRMLDLAINKNHIEFTLDYPEDNYAHTPFNMANIIDNFHKILDEIELRMYDGSIK